MGYGNKDPYTVQINNPSLDTLNNQLGTKADKSDLDTTNENVNALTTSLSQKIYFYNSVTSMVGAINLKIGDTVKTNGYYSSGDGGGASYTIVAGGTGTADGGSYINLANGLQAQLLETAYTNVRQFGARGDGITDDSPAFLANLAWGGMQKHKVKIPWGQFYLNQPITLNNSYLEGDGFQRTYIIMGPNGKFVVTNVRNVLEKMEIHGTDNTHYGNIGIELAGCSHSIIRDVELYWFNNAVQIDANSWSNTFDNVQAYYNDICFNLNGDQINNTNFISCHAESSRIGFQCLSGDSGFHYKVSFYGCHIELDSDAGIYINANGTYSFHGCYLERNNSTYQTGLDKGGLVVSYPSTYGARPATVDIIGCYHIQSTVRVKQSGTNTTTLISNWFKAITDASQYAIEILNPGQNLNKILNLNANYESVPQVTNSPNDVYDFNTNNMIGSTAQRPTNPTSGQPFYDTTVGKPISWNGNAWKDANGITPEVKGSNIAVAQSATTLPVSFTNQFITTYTINVAPSWNTTWWITNKTSTGFTINFGTAPSSASTLDWSIKG